MKDFEIRAIEVHSVYAWDYRWISKVLDFAKRTGLNALVLHRNDVVDQVVFPGMLFGVPEGKAGSIFERYNAAYRKIYKYTPTRRSGPQLRRDYLRKVVAKALSMGIQVYLQNKELFFPDVLLELFPELTKGGHVCACDPFWEKFLRVKYAELLEDVPDIAGVVTSLGTGESRVSITSNRCTCPLCAAKSTEEWYLGLLSAMYEPLAAKGKRLIVRDFVFTKKNQDQLASQFDKLPGDVAIAIKNTPHDYYPTFPTNTLIENLVGRDKWIEFDAMAQYFGWGISPSVLLEDYRNRFAHARAHGAKGIILRTDWESLDGHTAFDTPNIVNLYAGAALAVSGKARDEEIVGRWVEDARGFKDEGMPAAEKAEAINWLTSLLRRSWDVVRQGLFVQDCVFNDCSTFPVGYDQALWLTLEKNSLQDWKPEKAKAYDPEEANILAIICEKARALEGAGELAEYVDSCPQGYFSPEFLSFLDLHFSASVPYLRGFCALGTLFALLRFGIGTGLGNKASNVLLGGRALGDWLEKAVAEMDAVVAEYKRIFAETDFPHSFYQLMSADKIATFRNDAVSVARERLGWMP